MDPNNNSSRTMRGAMKGNLHFSLGPLKHSALVWVTNRGSSQRFSATY